MPVLPCQRIKRQKRVTEPVASICGPLGTCFSAKLRRLLSNLLLLSLVGVGPLGRVRNASLVALRCAHQHPGPVGRGWRQPLVTDTLKQVVQQAKKLL